MIKVLVDFVTQVGAGLTTLYVKDRVEWIFLPGLRRVNENIKYFPRETQSTVIFNLGTYVQNVDAEIGRRIGDGTFNESSADEILLKPESQRALLAAASMASSIDDEIAQRNLARLVVEMLAGKPGSATARVVSLSVQALDSLDPQNLRQLAYIFGVKSWDIRTTYPEKDDINVRLELVDRDLNPLYLALSDAPIIRYLEATLMEEVGVLKFRPSLSGASNPSFDWCAPTRHLAELIQPGTSLSKYSALSWLVAQTSGRLSNPEAFGITHFYLAPSGLALGYLTLCSLTGEEANLTAFLAPSVQPDEAT